MFFLLALSFAGFCSYLYVLDVLRYFISYQAPWHSANAAAERKLVFDFRRDTDVPKVCWVVNEDFGWRAKRCSKLIPKI